MLSRIIYTFYPPPETQEVNRESRRELCIHFNAFTSRFVNLFHENATNSQYNE